MTPAYAAKLCPKVQKINIRAQKIDSSTLDIFEIVLANFQVEERLGKTRFIQKTFLIVNTTLEVIFKILFLIFSNINIQFTQEELIQRSYTTKKALPTTNQVEFINKKEFAKLNVEVLVVFMFSLSLESIHLDKKAQIASLLTKEVTILDKYSDFTNVFLEQPDSVLLKQSKLN